MNVKIENVKVLQKQLLRQKCMNADQHMTVSLKNKEIKKLK